MHTNNNNNDNSSVRLGSLPLECHTPRYREILALVCCRAWQAREEIDWLLDLSTFLTHSLSTACLSSGLTGVVRANERRLSCSSSQRQKPHKTACPDHSKLLTRSSSSGGSTACRIVTLACPVRECVSCNQLRYGAQAHKLACPKFLHVQPFWLLAASCWLPAHSTMHNRAS